MMQTLKERYTELKTKRENLLEEGIMDYFKSGSQNIQKFNTTLAQLKQLANKYNIASLQAALATAEKQFTETVMQQTTGQNVPEDKTKSTMISKAVTLVSTIASFMDTFKNITTQLPAVKNALDNAKNEQFNKPLSDLLGNDAVKFSQLIATQLQKAGGGWLKAIGRFFSGGGGQNAEVVMKEFGLDATSLANDILKMTPIQLSSFSTESAKTSPFQFSQQTAPPSTQPTQKTVEPAGAAPELQPQPAQQPVPAQ